MSFVSSLMLNSTVNARFQTVNIWFIISVQECPKIMLAGNSYLISAVLKCLSWETLSTYNEKVEKACNIQHDIKWKNSAVGIMIMQNEPRWQSNAIRIYCPLQMSENY